MSPLSRTVVGGCGGAPITVSVAGSSGVSPLSRTVDRGDDGAPVTVFEEDNAGLSPAQLALGNGRCAPLRSPALVRDALRSCRTGGSGVSPPVRAGLLVGDSIAPRAGFQPRVAEWEVTVWVPSQQVGKT